MKRGEFIKHLIEQCGCILVREDNSGYSVVRNVISGEMSGVPANDVLRPATICRICKTLDVVIPAAAAVAAGIIDIINDNHNNGVN